MWLGVWRCRWVYCPPWTLITAFDFVALIASSQSFPPSLPPHSDQGSSPCIGSNMYLLMSPGKYKIAVHWGRWQSTQKGKVPKKYPEGERGGCKTRNKDWYPDTLMFKILTRSILGSMRFLFVTSLSKCITVCVWFKKGQTYLWLDPRDDSSW